jgi:hypothetical protein
MQIVTTAIGAACALNVVCAAPDHFEVKSLPGWKGPLLSKTYCGFTEAGTPPNGEGTQYFNYVFLESENDPQNDPVIVWYNGGPGAASMFGLFVELGPYYLNQESLENEEYNKTGIPQVIHNPYSWTKVANVIAVNNPPPIGYSYCEGGSGHNTGPSGDGYSCGDWDDGLVAKANHKFLHNLFTNDFPEYAKNELYITGESYAGIYVPTIVEQILDNPGPLNLRGFAVGDGCMGTDVLCGSGNPDKGPYFQIEFLHGHGQVSERTYNKIVAECPKAVLLSGKGASNSCKAAIEEMDDAIGGFFDYSLYDDCIYEEGFRRQLVEEISDEFDRRMLGGLNDYACPGIAMNIWLNRSDVREALHIQSNNRFNSADNGIGMNYTETERTVLPIYERARKLKDIRVLIYNGDTDPGINSMVTQTKYTDYFDSLNVTEKEAWRPWTTDNKQRMGGYVIEYPGNLYYLTVRGSGHMVPEYKPEITLSFIENFVKGKGFPRYKKPSGTRGTLSLIDTLE